jgi:hypothetical protein
VAGADRKRAGGITNRYIPQPLDPFKRSLHHSLGVDLDFYRQSDPTANRQFSRFWEHRDDFFINKPSVLDRRADIELTAGRHAVAERLSRRAAELREAPR